MFYNFVLLCKGRIHNLFVVVVEMLFFQLAFAEGFKFKRYLFIFRKFAPTAQIKMEKDRMIWRRLKLSQTPVGLFDKILLVQMGNRLLQRQISVQESEKKYITYWAWSKIKSKGMKPLKNHASLVLMNYTEKKRDISHQACSKIKNVNIKQELP